MYDRAQPLDGVAGVVRSDVFADGGWPRFQVSRPSGAHKRREDASIEIRIQRESPRSGPVPGMGSSEKLPDGLHELFSLSSDAAWLQPAHAIDADGADGRKSGDSLVPAFSPDLGSDQVTSRPYR